MSAFKGSSSASPALAQRRRQSDAAVEAHVSTGSRGTHATSRDALPREAAAAAAAVQHCLGARVCEALPARTGRTDGQKKEASGSQPGARRHGTPSLLARCRVRSTGRAAGSGRQRPGTPVVVVVVAAVHVGPVSAAGPPLLCSSPTLHCGRAHRRSGAESVTAHVRLRFEELPRAAKQAHISPGPAVH